MKKYLMVFSLVCTSASAQVAGVQYSTCIDFTQADVPITASPLALAAHASSGDTVTYSSRTLAVCSISGSVATLRRAGVCTILAKTANSAGYIGGQTPLSFNVTAVVSPPTGDPTVSISAPANNSTVAVGVPVSFSLNVTNALAADLYVCGVFAATVTTPFVYQWTPTDAGSCVSYAQVARGDGGLNYSDNLTLKVSTAIAPPLPPPPPPPATTWTTQQAFFAACRQCPGTDKIETATCAGYTIVALDGSVCVDSAKCMWKRL